MHTFTKRLLVLLACGAAGSGSVFGLTSLAKYKPYGVPDALREQWEAKQIAVRAAAAPNLSLANHPGSAQPTSVQPNAAPHAVVDQAEFDFGMLDAGVSAKHVFVIRNAGDAPLALAAGETSCKCTLSETSAELVAPGATAEVTLTWNAGSTREFYRQYAIIRTNDPKHREIELAVRGQIRTQFGFSTEELAAPAVSPGSRAEAETILYSQTLDDFEVTEVQCGLPGFEYQLEPISEDLLRSMSARVAWRLRVSAAVPDASGPFVDAVRVGLRSKQLGESSAVAREILFRGNVLSPVTFYGPQLHREKGLELGITSAGTEVVAHLIVRVRGPQIPSVLEVSAVEPQILRTEIEPITSRPGVFRLSVTIPADAPQTIFNTEQKHGFVEVLAPADPTIRNRVPVHGAVLAL